MVEFSPRIHDLVQTICHNPYSSVALRELLEMQTEESHRALRYLLETIPSFSQFDMVLDELEARGYLEPLDLLRAILENPWNRSHFPSRHAIAIRQISNYQDDPRAFELLVDVLRSDKYQTCARIRADAVHIMQEFDDERTLYVLANVLRYHPEDMVQAQAVETLSYIKNPYVMDILINYLDDLSPNDLIRHDNKYKGQLTTISERVLGAIAKMWKNGIRPVHSKNFLFILEKCLYAEDRAEPYAFSLLKQIDSQESKSILAVWKRRQQELATNEFQIFV